MFKMTGKLQTEKKKNPLYCQLKHFLSLPVFSNQGTSVQLCWYKTVLLWARMGNATREIRSFFFKVTHMNCATLLKFIKTKTNTQTTKIKNKTKPNQTKATKSQATNKKKPTKTTIPQNTAKSKQNSKTKTIENNIYTLLHNSRK